jgi:hypothetical protein
MEFNYSCEEFLNIATLLPISKSLPEYEVFNEIESSWNIAMQKYGHYLQPFTDIERHKILFYLIKDACDNKKLTIKNPFKDEIISSDIYFITHLTSDNDNDLVFNYYFKEQDIVLGLLSGSGITGLAITFAYIIYRKEKRIFFFKGLNFDIQQNANYFLPKIRDVVESINIEKINSEPSLIRTLEGHNVGLFHTCCTFVNGIYIMEQIGINNDIDEIIMGPNDPFLIEKYYRNRYPNINVVKSVTSEIDIYKIYKGVIFKYGHFHLINKGAEFIKSYIKNVMPISETYKNEIEYIKENFYPIFSINLRCVTCEIKDQSLVISDVINKLKNIYPNSFFLIGGFLGDYNEELIKEKNVIIASLTTSSYNQILNIYENTFENIKNNVNHNNIKSLLNLKVNNILEFIQNVHFSINMNAGYTCIETILNNIPSTYFGTYWNDHNKRVFYISKQNYIEPIFIEDPTKIKFYSHEIETVYRSITCEISSDTIVDVVISYDKSNNNMLKKSL